MASSAKQVLVSEVGVSGDLAKINIEEGQSPELDAVKTLGYKPELQRNRSMFTLLFQSLAISAVGSHVSGDWRHTHTHSPKFLY